MVNCCLCHQPVKVSTEKHLFDEKMKKRMHIRCFAGICPGCDKPVAKWLAMMVGKDAYHKTCLKRAGLRENVGEYVEKKVVDAALDALKEKPKPAEKPKAEKKNPGGIRIATQEEFLRWWTQGLTLGLIRYDGVVLDGPDVKRFADWWLHGYTYGIVKTEKPIGLEKGGSIIDYLARSFTLGIVGFGDDPSQVVAKTNPGERWLTEAELTTNPMPAEYLNPRRNPKRKGTAEEQGLAKMAMEVAARAEKEGKDGLEAAINYLQLITQTPAVEKITKTLKQEWMFKHKEEVTENPVKCRGCEEELTSEEVNCVCVTDDSGTYHAWCYPNLKALQHKIDGLKRQNPDRPTSEFWNKVYPKVLEGYLQKYRPSKAEELARAATGAIWYRKMSSKKRKEYEARENPKKPVSKVGTGAPFLLVDSYGQVLERNQGSDGEAESGRLTLENKLGRPIKMVRPKDFIKLAEKAKRSVG